MKLAFNFKNGSKEVISDENTKKVIASINYLKLIKALMSSRKIENEVIKVLDKEIKVNELKSIEVLF